MKKVLSYFIISFLVLSTLGVVAYAVKADNETIHVCHQNEDHSWHDEEVNSSDLGSHEDGGDFQSQDQNSSDDQGERDSWCGEHHGEHDHGKLNVTKVISGGDDSDFTHFSFSVDEGAVTAFDASGTNEVSVSTGTHTIVENPIPENYTVTYDNCSDVKVHEGDEEDHNHTTPTCTITNTYVPPVVDVCPNEETDPGIQTELPCSEQPTLVLGACGAVMSRDTAIPTGFQNDSATYNYTMPDLTPATAGNSADHRWVQVFNDEAGRIVWDMGTPTDSAYLVPSIDHDPTPGESHEATLFGSNNATGPWETGVETSTDTFGPSNWISDNDTTLWKFTQPYKYVSSTAGGSLVNDGDAEIDAVCAPVISEPTTATIVATKIVCDNESDLPNWGNNGADITSTTATDFLSTHSSCHLAPWTFEWAPNGTGNPGDNVGVAGGSWTPFTTSVTIPAGGLTWVREEMKDGYVPFSSATSNLDEVASKNSAEFYCSNDVLNYDNYDFINPVVAGQTYYCVGFNAVTPVPPPQQGTLVVKKIIVGNDSVNYGAFSFMIGDSAPAFFDNADGQNEINENVGQYSVTETANALYTTTYSNSENSNTNCNNLDVTNDGTVTCFVTNTLIVVPPTECPQGQIGFPDCHFPPIECSAGQHAVENQCVADSCSDGIQNQNETGVDTGGVCAPATPTDMCPNISGVQLTVPSGKHKDNQGNCVNDAHRTGSHTGGSISQGQVLGAETQICNWDIKTYMRKGYKNDAEQVKILQRDLLNGFMKLGVTVDGVYGPKTEEGVKAFQTAKKDKILTPWNLTIPTGIFYKTTLVEAKNTICPAEILPIPTDLTPWSANSGVVPALTH